MPDKSFYLPTKKYSKNDNPSTGFAYNQSSHAGGFRNDCSGFVSDALRTNGYDVPKDFNTSNIKAWAASPNPYFDKVGMGSSLKPVDFKDGDVVMIGSGHTGIVFTDAEGTRRIADWGTSTNGFRSEPIKLDDGVKNGWFGLPINEVIRPKPETYHAENDQTSPGHAYANPAWVATPIPDAPNSTSESGEPTDATDPMGSDDGKSIMDAASTPSETPNPSSTSSPPSAPPTRPDENYSHEGRNSSSAAGDAVDAPLPDGTRVISTSSTVNGQTTVTTELLDKDGHVLLSAGAGQTMVRDPDTGIVQVQSNGSGSGNASDTVKQYDPATGAVSDAPQHVPAATTEETSSSEVFEELQNAFANMDATKRFGPDVQVADASGATGAGTMTDAGWISAGGGVACQPLRSLMLQPLPTPLKTCSSKPQVLTTKATPLRSTTTSTSKAPFKPKHKPNKCWATSAKALACSTRSTIFKTGIT